MDCKKTFLVITVLLFFYSALSHAFESPVTSPIGYWRIMDKSTGKPKSIVQIWRTKDQVLKGKIVKVFPNASKLTGPVCTACKGDFHNQPLVGMVILSSLANNQSPYSGGKILNPENGTTYKCSLKLTEKGRKLKVNGFIGLPLFGRSEVWERVDLMSG